MPPKRKRRVSVTPKGLAPGERLKRSSLPGNHSSPWGWVGAEVTNTSDITSEHISIACGLSKRNNHPFCSNKFSQCSKLQPAPAKLIANPNEELVVNGEPEGDVIDISDDEQPECTRKLCKSNPYCLNYLGQEAWENEDEAVETFLKTVNNGENPVHDIREPDLPVGLKNLGATCYANASLQVWFRDLTFRNGVYACQPSEDTEHKFKESPIFQLQVTFAALQESTQNVYNPTKLVESLQLRTTEQQDAQEFSKLFMSHLDSEFRKQGMPAVKSLITDQFQGTQIYGTICNHCNYRSERTTDFLEIEINLASNSKLEDQINALLLPETLSGDNKYFCSHCNSLQDATRYTELRELPHVLHFSLLRFVYDVSTTERKKLKHIVSFPTTLDMNQFLTPSESDHLPSNTPDQNVYELRGILLHKGSSAYHGHYEAQVYDTVAQSWFQFNDEIVTKLKALSEKPMNKGPWIDVEDENKQSPGLDGRKQRANVRKRRRVDDSDDGANEDNRTTPSAKNSPIKHIPSKDAYMLIYARKTVSYSHTSLPGSSLGVTQTRPTPIPPPRALEVIKSLNAIQDKACDLYHQRERLLKARVEHRRRQIMNIYRSWNVQPVNNESVVVSKKALTAWLSQHHNEFAPSLAKGLDSTATPETANGSPPPTRIPLDDILCVHQCLDPQKASQMKLISKQAYTQIVKDTWYTFHPILTPNDVCDVCVKTIFKERLYQIEHPRLVNQFDQISEVALGCRGYWISKSWLRDWRLLKPKMHVISEGDPAPDASGYESDVLCEHQGLSLNSTSRRKISVGATTLLQTLYPSWDPLSTDSEPCPVCDALIHISKDGKRETRRRAEEEKAKLKHMNENDFGGDVSLLESVPYVLIPVHFLKAWRQWLDQSTELPRPEAVDNRPFICEHDLLNLDPNSPMDFDSCLAIIRRSDWDVLQTLYPGGPMIAIERSQREGSQGPRLLHDIPICSDCRLKRKSDWVTTQISVRLGGTNAENSNKKGQVSYPQKYGARQSRRLRQIKRLGERRRLTVSKTTSVKDIKIMLQDELKITTICQRLFYEGHELTDNTATIASLNIYANDILDLWEESEVIEINSDSEETRPRGEERGFGGTLLGSARERPPLSDEGKQGTATDVIDGKPCSACTFSNDLDALSCTMCDTLFE